jgi:hypothetical protein
MNNKRPMEKERSYHRILKKKFRDRIRGKGNLVLMVNIDLVMIPNL